MVENFLQALFAGLTVGSIYGLMCVGLALIFGVMRVINFAQGEFMMLGMYGAFYIFTAFGIQAALGINYRPVCCSSPRRAGAVLCRLSHPPGPDRRV